MIRKALVSPSGVVLDAMRFESEPNSCELALWLWGDADAIRLHPATGQVMDPADGDERGTVMDAPDDQPIGYGWTYASGVFSAPVVTAPRVVDAAGFLALFTPAEVAALWASDPRLMVGALKVAGQDACNLESTECAQLLGLAVAKGCLTRARADRVLTGRPPA